MSGDPMNCRQEFHPKRSFKTRNEVRHPIKVLLDLWMLSNDPLCLFYRAWQQPQLLFR